MNVFLACFLAVLFANVMFGLAVKSFLTWKTRAMMKRFIHAGPDGLPPRVSGPVPLAPMHQPSSPDAWNANLALDQAALRYGAHHKRHGHVATEAGIDLVDALARAAAQFYEMLPDDQREVCLSMRPRPPYTHGHQHGAPPS
jgi:hypothetical protein